jgi:TPR repeat protein
MVTLGEMYAKGVGVEKDVNTSLAHFRVAAAAGNLAGVNALGY